MLEQLLIDPSTGERIPEQGRVRFTLNSANLEREVWIPFMAPSELTADRVMTEVDRVLQSKRDWLFNEPMNVLLVHAPIPAGGTWNRRCRTRLATFLNEKKSIIQVKEAPNNTCCARAILYAKHSVDGDTVNVRRFRKNPRRMEPLVINLHNSAGVPMGVMCALSEWERFQNSLGVEYSLVVLSRDHFNCIVYRGNPTARKTVAIYHADRHYHAITSLKAFLGRSYVCPVCLTGYSNRGEHNCEQKCSRCDGEGNCPVEHWKECAQCRRFYPSEKCFKQHKDNNVCGAYVRCADCDRVYKARTVHECGVVMCKHCNSLKPVSHKCYMKPVDNEKRKSKQLSYVIYDFESMLLQNGQHCPNLCVCHVVCAKCITLPMVEDSECTCGRERVVFKGVNTVEHFGDWLFTAKRKNTVCIAHNAKGYDLHFLLAYLHARAVKPEMIQNGRKIMSLSVGGVKCIDSLNFLPMALARLPAAFGLTELSKGYFPHLFNIPDNQDYRGIIPYIKYYDPDGMRSETREPFLAWYEEHRHQPFDLQKELLKYCISDVDILQRACGSFREMFAQVAQGIEPFASTITIASACNLVYRSLFLQEEQIALIPPQGYYMGKQSSIALTWLTMEADRTAMSIRHAGNEGELLIEGYRVRIKKK